MKPATFTMTEQQLDWLACESEKTGLTKVEIVRRALDAYKASQAAKENLAMFTPAQKKDIKLIAEIYNLSETEVIRKAIDHERERVTQRLKKRGAFVK